MYSFLCLTVLGLCWDTQAFSCHGAQASLPCGMWDLSSPTRDQTPVCCIGRQILNHWTSLVVQWLRICCIGRQILNHWTTREVLSSSNFLNWSPKFLSVFQIKNLNVRLLLKNWNIRHHWACVLRRSHQPQWVADAAVDGAEFWQSLTGWQYCR